MDWPRWLDGAPAVLDGAPGGIPRSAADFAALSECNCASSSARVGGGAVDLPCPARLDLPVPLLDLPDLLDWPTELDGGPGGSEGGGASDGAGAPVSLEFVLSARW